MGQKPSLSITWEKGLQKHKNLSLIIVICDTIFFHPVKMTLFQYIENIFNIQKVISYY